jgi:RNA polymerase sigma factor (sigma-70 family)
MLSTDSAALEYAFARYRSDVYAFVLSRLRDREDAEELTQQTFVDAAAALARGAAPRAMRTWLFSVAQRRIADELRRRGRRAMSVRADIHEDAAAEPGLAGALDGLSPEDRRDVPRVQRGRVEDARLPCRSAPARRARHVTKP